ncbi:hypothetical protein [Pseudovibrio sp. Tun.PSC04-5.I4]|uniref:hypothetical protein n=1 Tax=Pseudovibrio sp. Tun.PSC04-5.I4 TaxID=1798213 RepID=UPI00088A7BBB|nr:hypothetical protein [Pseudovibrio sp. Tun.PSC04-5.I4]SDR36936.1 hypothetical protein SAMN04515695_5032 [Pseudovibrio sp. Tun.PSC04-5.I4]
MRHSLNLTHTPAMLIRLAVSLCFLMGSAASTLAQSNNRVSESLLYQPRILQNGWRKDIDALTHFSGMFCPDYIGKLSRSVLIPDMKELGIGCIYETEGGKIKTIFRRHKKGTAKQVLSNFNSGFTESHFQQLKLGIPENEIAFRTETMEGMGRIESLISYTAPTSDYTVWTSISDQLPISELDEVRLNFMNLAIKIETDLQKN